MKVLVTTASSVTTVNVEGASSEEEAIRVAIGRALQCEKRQYDVDAFAFYLGNVIPDDVTAKVQS